MRAVARDSYFRSRWDNQAAYVEVWLEKDALSGVVFPVTGELDVPLMVTRGYPSISFLHGAAETIARQGKPSYLYYFGDHDPSGVDITRSVADGILRRCIESHVDRAAWAATERAERADRKRLASLIGE